MSFRRQLSSAAIIFFMASVCPQPSDAQTADLLPPGVRAVWNLGRAWRQATPTRERVCVNGLWRWQPGHDADESVPVAGWGYFKVPGCWPGISDYLQKDSQTLYPNPGWKDRKLSEVTSAWYQRQVEIPAEWAGRRIALSVECLNSYAAVYVDGKKAGELRFPGGEVDLSPVCRAGGKYLLDLHVIVMPLKAVMLSYADTAAAKEVRGTVARRGLCGDVYLVSVPAVARLGDVSVETSVRREQVTVNAAVDGLAPGRQYTLRAEITRAGRVVIQFASKSFVPGDLSEGRIAFSTRWKPSQLWDLDTPQNTYDVQVSLLDASGKVLDANWSERFGFRELWIDGRDFYLNGSRVFLCAVPLDNAQIGAAQATYAAARETLLRLKRIGINLVYTHNYGCEPGAHLSFAEILRAADDVGMLVALSQPHFSQYDWKATDADLNNGYAHHAAFYVRAAGSHPSVVFYAMSHNATGYEQDMDPDLIDGLHDPRQPWAANNAKLALRAEAIVRRLDGSRIVYHHAGGNIGSMHTVNFYPNFAPVQELSEWFGHWAAAGVKPLFLCEYGAPFTWDWTLYRGWYQGKREFGSAAVPWEFCLAEWDAQFLGDRAFAMQEQEKANLRWEARQFEVGRIWHRWDYPTDVGSPRFEQRNEVLARYLADNWRAYRTWGVSGISPWEYEIFWTPRGGIDRRRKQLEVDWDNLQRPGLSSDYIDSQVERMDTAFRGDDWVPTAAGEALLRNNQAVLAYIAGKASAFTSKDHNFLPGQTVEKQLVLINNARRTLTFRCNWSLQFAKPVSDQKIVTVETGQQARIPLRFDLPPATAPGAYEIRASVRFDEGQEQSDAFVIHVLPAPAAPRSGTAVVLFDPRGETGALFQRLDVAFRRVDADAVLAPDDILVIGKLALTVDGPAPDIGRVRDGLKVIVFEQSSQALEKRLGFRVAEYGLRRIFERIPDHALLAGIDPQHLSDWWGEATTLPPRLSYDLRPRYGPTVRWCDIPVTRIWRCGNRGNVASVLIEKPSRGDFRPILDGGFDLQYSPLMEYREGKGLVVFCQLDVTCRTEADPAADLLVRNLTQYAAAWKADPARHAVYVGEPAGKAHFESAGIDAGPYDGGELSLQKVLIIGPRATAELATHAPAVARLVKGGGRVLAIGLNQKEAEALLPYRVEFVRREHVSAVFDPPALNSLLAGIGPADVEVRAPREVSLIAGGATLVGDGVLGFAAAGKTPPNVVFCQFAPWQLDYSRSHSLKRTYRRWSFLLARVLGNLGVAQPTPLLRRFHAPLRAPVPEKRWLDGLYLEVPEEWDDPYRFFRW